MTFQHDGHRAVRESEVEGLSKPFQSTKGAATVGFMGVGFKSVFGRFREARISGWGWTFRYKVDVVGERYGDVQTDLLGTVMPIWDDRIPQPDSGFTTRFDLSSRLDDTFPDQMFQHEPAHSADEDPHADRRHDDKQESSDGSGLIHRNPELFPNHRYVERHRIEPNHAGDQECDDEAEGLPKLVLLHICQRCHQTLSSDK